MIYFSHQQLSATQMVYSPQQSCKMELQNNGILTYDGCFGFHRVANAKENRLFAHPEPNQHKCWRSSVALNV